MTCKHVCFEYPDPLINYVYMSYSLLKSSHNSKPQIALLQLQLQFQSTSILVIYLLHILMLCRAAHNSSDLLL